MQCVPGLQVEWCRGSVGEKKDGEQEPKQGIKEDGGEGEHLLTPLSHIQELLGTLGLLFLYPVHM